MGNVLFLFLFKVLGFGVGSSFFELLIILDDLFDEFLRPFFLFHFLDILSLELLGILKRIHFLIFFLDLTVIDSVFLFVFLNVRFVIWVLERDGFE